MQVSDDALLGGQVRFTQPCAGYRAAIDPVLLAAAVLARPDDAVLELGIGAGAASLCLAARVAGCRITGLERDPDLAALATDNARRNGFCTRLRVHCSDLRHPPQDLRSPQGGYAKFDHVMFNPPYLTAEATDPSPHPSRAAANVETAGTGLDVWLETALEFLRHKGWVTVIHRAERLDHLLACLWNRAGSIEVLPLWPKAGRPAKRVIVRARKGVATPLRLGTGLILHAADGSYTAAAAAILRDAAAFEPE